MASIITNQQSAFVSEALRHAHNLATTLEHVSPAQRAAILAITTKQSSTPIDLVLLGERGDEAECAAILDGVLARSSTHRTQWKLGSGCLFTLSILPGEGDPHA